MMRMSKTYTDDDYYVQINHEILLSSVIHYLDMFIIVGFCCSNKIIWKIVYENVDAYKMLKKIMFKERKNICAR